MSSSSSVNSSNQIDSAENVIKKAKFENASDPNSSNSSSSSSLSIDYLPTSQSILSVYSKPSNLHPLSNLGTATGGLDYISLDDSALSSIAGSQTVLPNRGWSDELCYGTGTVYVSGLIFGGFWGLKEGWSRSKAIAAGRVAKSFAIDPSNLQSTTTTSTPKSTTNSSNPSSSSSSTIKGPTINPSSSNAGNVSWKLKINSVLNGITRRGSFVGNTSGVLALMYNVFNCTLDRYRGQHDSWNSVIAGGLTGALFRCTAGPQKMVIASSLMALGAMGWSKIKPSLI